MISLFRHFIDKSIDFFSYQEKINRFSQGSSDRSDFPRLHENILIDIAWRIIINICIPDLGTRSRNIVIYTDGTKLGDVVNTEMNCTVIPQKKNGL